MIGQIRRFTPACVGKLGTRLDPKLGMVAHEFVCVNSKSGLNVPFDWQWGRNQASIKTHIFHTVERYVVKEDGKFEVWIGFGRDGVTMMIPRERRDRVLNEMGGWE